MLYEFIISIHFGKALNKVELIYAYRAMPKTNSPFITVT